MISIDMTGKTMLMTGALSASGGLIIRRALDAGCFAILTDIASRERAEGALEAAGIPSTGYFYLPADLRSESSISGMVKEAFRLRPTLDIVLGHAGGCTLHPFETTSSDEFARIFELNFTSQTWLARAVLNEWVSRKCEGHLLFTSSYVAQVPHTRIPAYACAKAALETFTKCMALEYAPHRIRFNALSPGNIAIGSSLAVYDQDAEYRSFVDRVTPWGERNTVDGIADGFLFLISSLSREINGMVLHVDNGISIPKIG